MYKYLVLFILGSPLLGLILMEGGEYGWSVGLRGYPNGASVAYAVYAIVFVVFAYWGGMRWKSNAVFPDTQATKLDTQYSSYIIGVLVAECVLLGILLFPFEGFRVWSGEIDKATFRSNLGSFSAFAFLITKFLIPGLLAYGACLYLQTDRKGKNQFLWWAACGMAFVIGSVWGFKSTAMFVLLPSLLIIFWQTSLRQFVVFSFVALMSFVVMSLWFDTEIVYGATFFEGLWIRSTVLQGDVSWFVWEQFVRGEKFPSYGWTLLTFIGDNVFGVLSGIDRSQALLWSEYHYDYMLNFIAGRPLYESGEGGSITATTFSEGLIAGGIPGVLLFGALAGIIVGWIFRALSRAINEGRIVRVALLSNYFIWVVIPWLNGGGITQLFHVATIAGMLSIYVAIMILNGSATRGARQAVRYSHSWLPQRH
jgi:hypothetical protein